MKTVNTIQKRRETIETNINKWRAELSDLQEECPHASVEKTHRANTGNYDPSADCYWTDFKCPDCGKRWTEEGSK